MHAVVTSSFVLITALSTAMSASAQSTPAPLPGGDNGPQVVAPGPAPELELRDLSGASQRLSALRGRIVVLSFLSVSCESCRERLATLVEMQSELAVWGVQVVGVIADGPAEPGAVAAFVRRHKLNFPIWVGATPDDVGRFAVDSQPTETVVIDSDGRVVARFTGPVRKGPLRTSVEALVAVRRAESKAMAAAPGSGGEPVAAARVPS